MRTLAALRYLLICGGLSSLLSCADIGNQKPGPAPVEGGKSGKQIYKAYPGSVRPASDLARILLDDIMYATVDGLGVDVIDYKEMRLLPGVHTVEMTFRRGGSEVDRYSKRKPDARIAAELLAGHSYHLCWSHSDPRSGKFRSNWYYFWIEDTSSKEIVGTPASHEH